MNMRGVIAFALLVVLAKGVEAGGVYGSLQIDGRAVAEGTQIALNCSGQVITSAVQKYGRYRVQAQAEGPCSFSVSGYAGAVTQVISYREATRYNLIITSHGNGYSLKRR